VWCAKHSGPISASRTGFRVRRWPYTCEGPVRRGESFLLNDRVDIALAVGAEGAVGSVGAVGVHLGTRSIPPAEARPLLGANRLLGVSVHSVSDAARAAEGGADYLFVGTLFETASHPKAVVRGAEFVGEVAAHVEIPLVGIGGVTPERTIDVLASGGHGVAVMRGIWNAPSPSDAVHAYLDAIEQAIREKRVTLHE
jgi:thiamine-phosphate diphosphorylase